MAPAKGRSKSDHTARIVVGRVPSNDGESHTLSCHITGWSDQFGLPDGIYQCSDVAELQVKTDSAFGGLQTMAELSKSREARFFDYTTGNLLGGALRSTSYREGESESVRRSD